MDKSVVLLIIKGMLCGIIISGSIGPVLLLSLQCTLKKRWYHGFASGMGATVADTIYCAIAMMSLSLIYDLVVAHGAIFRSITAVVLLGTGIHMYVSNQRAPVLDVEHMGVTKEFVKTFVLGISNPMTMAGVIFVASLLGGIDPKSYTINGLLFIMAFFSGATGWWLLLSLVISQCKRFVSSRIITVISHGSGIAVFMIGLFMLLAIFFRIEFH